MLQGWLDERLEYMGFEAQRFPQLLPLSPEQANGSSSSNGPAGSTRQAEEGVEEGASSCTSRTFARWVQEAEGDLPVLASQWHDVDRCAGLGVDGVRTSGVGTRMCTLLLCHGLLSLRGFLRRRMFAC